MDLRSTLRSCEGMASGEEGGEEGFVAWERIRERRVGGVGGCGRDGKFRERRTMKAAAGGGLVVEMEGGCDVKAVTGFMLEDLGFGVEAEGGGGGSRDEGDDARRCVSISSIGEDYYDAVRTAVMFLQKKLFSRWGDNLDTFDNCTRKASKPYIGSGYCSLAAVKANTPEYIL